MVVEYCWDGTAFDIEFGSLLGELQTMARYRYRKNPGLRF